MNLPRETTAAGIHAITVDLRKISDSGIGTYIRNIIPRVIRRMPDVSFHLLGPSESICAHVGDLPNSRIVECAVRPLSAREQVQLGRHIPGSADLFWATHFNIPISYRGQLLVTIHDVMPLAMPELSGGPLHSLYVRAMMAAIRARQATVICVSEFTASEIVRLASVPRDRITVIHEAVDEAWSSVLRSARPHAVPYLLFVGLVKPHKNLLALMRAFEILSGKWPHDLVIVGDRDKIVTRDQESARFAKRFGQRVVFTGRVSDKALEQYVAFADALIVPSLYEGFGLPALEAMACGCPVIASSAASLPEVCGDAALFFDPHSPSDLANAVERCLGDDSRREAMIVRGRAQAQSFSWDRAADETASVIRGMLEDLASRRRAAAQSHQCY